MTSRDGAPGALGATTTASTPSSRNATARLWMNEPTGSPGKRGYACARKSTRRRSGADTTLRLPLPGILEHDAGARGRVGAGDELDAPIRCDARRPRGAPHAPPCHDVAHRR